MCRLSRSFSSSGIGALASILVRGGTNISEPPTKKKFCAFVYVVLFCNAIIALFVRVWHCHTEQTVLLSIQISKYFFIIFKYRDRYLKMVFKYSLKYGYLNSILNTDVLHLVFVIFQILPYNFQYIILLYITYWSVHRYCILINLHSFWFQPRIVSCQKIFRHVSLIFW